jgi:hypothetical protein
VAGPGANGVGSRLDLILPHPLHSLSVAYKSV